VEKSCVAKAKKVKDKYAVSFHCNLLCVSPKHGMHGSLRCLKFYKFTTVELFFCPRTVVKLR